MDKSRYIPISLIICIVEIITGILLLIHPVIYTHWFLILLGIVLIAMSVGNIVNIIRCSCTGLQINAVPKKLIQDILFLLVGAILTLEYKEILNLFPVLPVFYGLMNLAGAIYKTQRWIAMLRAKQKYSNITMISALLTIILSALMLVNPFAAVGPLWIFTGISLIAESAFDTMTAIIMILPFKDNR